MMVICNEDELITLEPGQGMSSISPLEMKESVSGTSTHGKHWISENVVDKYGVGVSPPAPSAEGL